MTTSLLPRRHPADRRRLAAATCTALAGIAVLGATVLVAGELATPRLTVGDTPPPLVTPAPVDDASDDPTATPTTPVTESPTPADPPTTPLPSEPARPDPSARPADPVMGTAEVQEQLRAHGFLLGPVTGERDQQTIAAIMAYQRVNGLAVDGVVGPLTTAALASGSALPVLAGGPADRVEVDLDRQLLHLVRDGQRVVTLQVSSGNGETYTNARGLARARTPVGEFTVERRVHGTRVADLGVMYDPLYFHGGFAVHGSTSVPPWPASHGCIRVTIADAAWLIEHVPDGLPVHVYGGTHVFAP